LSINEEREKKKRNPQLNSSTSCLHDNSLARTTQKTQPLHFEEACLPSRCITTVATRTYRKHRPSIVGRVRFGGNVFTEPLLTNGLHNPVVLLLRQCMLRTLHSNGICLQNHHLGRDLYATVILQLLSKENVCFSFILYREFVLQVISSDSKEESFFLGKLIRTNSVSYCNCKCTA
jgi:hypothetical protein